MIEASSITLRLYKNVSNQRLVWADPWGRTVSVDAGRGLSAAPSVELGRLVAKGLLVEVHEQRGYSGPLPNSTDRRIPI